MHKILNTKYKHIEFINDIVISTYYWFDDYDFNYYDFNHKSKNYDFHEYKQDILNSYELARKYFNLEIIEYYDEYIKTSCPRYDDNLLNFFNKNKCDDNVEKYKTILSQLLYLIKFQKDNNIIHNDLAFRNICYKFENNEIKLYLIDFETLKQDNDFTHFMSYIYYDIKDLIGKSFSDEFMSMTNKILNIDKKY